MSSQLYVELPELQVIRLMTFKRTHPAFEVNTVVEAYFKVPGLGSQDLIVSIDRGTPIKTHKRLQSSL